MELVPQRWHVQNLFVKLGVQPKNITMIDRKGVIYKGRDNLNEWKTFCN